ncbi:MAG: diguanylate cyclase domain-containing protein, partial [Spirochaetota bacterium]
LGLLVSNLVLLVLEMATRGLNGVPGDGARTAVWVGNLLLFACNLLPALFWILYVTFHATHDEVRVRRAARVLLVLLGLHALAVFSTPITHLMFTVDSANRFARGSGYAITAALNFGLVGYSFVYTAVKHEAMTRKQLVSMLLFPVFPAVGAVVQVIHYDLPLIWSTLSLSVILVFINVQTELLNTDYLTGLANRRSLHDYLRRKVAEASRSRTFAVLMIDLDDFKSINDRFGHQEGDVALERTARVISSAVRSEDFVARYAGDEFVVVLDIGDREALGRAIARIESALAAYNRDSDKPYVLSFSLGAGIFSESGARDLDRFIQEVDERMYEAKRRRSAKE